MCEDVAGLLRDKIRKPSLPPLPPPLIERVVELTLREPTGRLGDALDGPSDGGSHRRVVEFGTANLGGARPATAPSAAFLAVTGSGLCRRAARRSSALSRPTGSEPGAVG
jgi:hypothetical protein